MQPVLRARMWNEDPPDYGMPPVKLIFFPCEAVLLTMAVR
jgi:hypothetical protein